MRQQHAFNQWAQGEDAKFAQANPQLVDPAERQRVESAVVQLAMQHYGVSPAELAHHYRTSPVLRSAAGQQMMLDALRYHQAVESGRRPAAPPVPRFQKPGVARPAGAEYESEIAEHRGGGVRDAAKLLIAIRRGRE